MNNVYLTGIMGCGKSTLGREAARRLHRKFIDIDQYIEESQGQTIPSIFEKQGETGFRKIETECLKRIAEEISSAIVATGGGIATIPENVRVMKESGKIVFLKKPLEEIKESLGSAEGRPVLQGKLDALDEIYQKRLPAYEGSADLIFDNRGPIEQAIERILAAFSQLLSDNPTE